MTNETQPQSFTWISYTTENDNPYITVDSQKRLYLSSAAIKLIGLNAFPAQLIIGYDHANKRLVAAKPDVVRAVNVRPFSFDRRRYCSAKPFIRALALRDADLPLRFEYAGKDYANYAEGSFAFTLAEFDAPDGGLPVNTAE